MVRDDGTVTETAASGWLDRDTNRRVWRMAGPIILSNISVPLLGAVDTAVVGHLSEAYYLGAVAAGAMIFNFIYFGFNCLRMGTTGPTAQAVGAGDSGEVRAILGRALFLAGVIAAGLVLLQWPIAEIAFRLIGASHDVESHGRTYFLIRVWAIPAVLGTYVIIGWFYGLEDARIPLVIQIATNGLNMVLDFAFVYGFGWDVAGVAGASVIAEYAGLALGLSLVVRRLRRLPEPLQPPRILDVDRLYRMVAINRDIFFRTICVVSTLAIFIGQSAGLGDVTLAANQVLVNFLQVTAFAVDGFAHAAEALIGEAIGRRTRAGFGRAVRAVLVWTAIIGALNVAIYWLVGDAIIRLLTGIEEVRALARAFLPWAVFMPAVSAWAFTFDGIFLGATRTRAMRNTMFLAFGCFLATVFWVTPSLGNTGLWLAYAVFLSVRGIGLAAVYPSLRRSIG